MNTLTKYYISASRRTDIPCFFVDEFFSAWLKGEITYNAGYGRSYTLSLKPNDVLGYIFWSKNFAPLINHPLFRKLFDTNNAVFHFTINDCLDLEPRLAPLKERLETLRTLCEIVGPERILWRFDPVCKYCGPHGKMQTNEESFYSILPIIHNAGIRRCYFSFMTFYAKLNARGVEFGRFTQEEKTEIGSRMLSACTQAGISLYSCCNEDVPGLVPGIQVAHCIDEDLLRETDRFGVHRPLFLKPTHKGCGCFESRDIGSYDPKCSHGCRYCYANPETIL